MTQLDADSEQHAYVDPVDDSRALGAAFRAAADGLFANDIPSHLRITHSDPKDSCRLCAQRDLAGSVLHGVGRSGPEQRVAALLRKLNLHVHTLPVVGGHEADVALPLAPQPVVVEYDGSYWHTDGGYLEDRQRTAWERAGFRVVRLREPPLQSTGEWDLVLAGAFRRFDQEVVSAAIGLHVVEAARIASMAESGSDRESPAAPEGWWVATEVRDGVASRPVAKWRTWVGAQLGAATAFEALDRDWEAGEIIGALEFVPGDGRG